MKLIDLWRTATKPTISFELFPARTPKAAQTLEGVIGELVAARPDFMSVTFGAGGSTRDGSRDLIAKLRGFGLELVAYFACYGLGPADVTAVLDSYAELGVQNVLAVRGDIPREEPRVQPHPEGFAHASDLLAFLRGRYPFCLGAAGYPEGHLEAPSKEKDIEFLKLKVDQGAEYVIAQYFYDNRYFFDFIDRCRSAGINVPIVPGIMPIYSLKMMETLAGICGATITQAVRTGLARLPEGDKDAVAAFGIDFATDQCRELLRAGVPGIHIYTLDRSSSAIAITERLRVEKLL